MAWDKIKIQRDNGEFVEAQGIAPWFIINLLSQISNI